MYYYRVRGFCRKTGLEKFNRLILTTTKQQMTVIEVAKAKVWRSDPRLQVDIIFVRDVTAGTHSAECEATFRLYEQELTQFNRRYPGYCRVCGGTGELVYDYDPSPPGISLGSGSMEDGEPCPHCAEEGICPRCGSEDVPWDKDNPEYFHCQDCGFDQNEPVEAAPTPPDCYCWRERDQEEV